MKYVTILTLSVCYLLISSPLKTLAQTGSTTKVLQRLSASTAVHTIEKVYLQFDKPYYAAGDTIYYKGYVTIGAAHKLSALSGVLHVELIGPDSKVLSKEKLLVTAGTAHGDLALADSLKSGSYRIRAYTNWMRNNGDDNFFEQIIQIGAVPMNQITPKSVAAKTKAKPVNLPQDKPAIQFMPEGGNLVNGNYSKIAFKALAPNGRGITVSGIVTDNAGNTVVNFASGHLGMGAFMMVPEDGKTYTANVTYADGTTNSLPLPIASNKGYTINLNNTQADTLRIRISAGPGSSLKQVSLVAQAAGELLYASENQSDDKFFSAVIPKSKFPTGIVQFTLFSATGEPLNERLAFIDNHDELKLDVKAEKQSYQPRQKVKIDLDIKSKNNKPATGSFSVAITDESKVQPDSANEQSILSNLLLTSDLKGTVEQPGYYFNNKNEQIVVDLDNLLLTQGYRHFEWKEVLSDKRTKPAYEAEKSIQISGTVKRGNKPAAGAKVTLFSKAGGTFMLDTLTDAGGRFAFRDLVFADSTKFVVQSKVAKGQDAVTLSLDTLTPPSVSIKSINANAEPDTAKLTAYIKSEKQFHQNQQKYGLTKQAIALKEVTIKDRSNRKIIPNSQNLNGAGHADQVLTAKDLEKFTCGNLMDCLSGALTGVIFRTGRALNVQRDLAPMAVIIDGNFAEFSDFQLLDNQDIEGIEVILGPNYGAIYGARMANGGLIVTTKRAKNANGYYRYAPGVVSYMPKGFYKAREFYSPQYDNPKTNTNMPDLRSTIYWQPDIITDKEGKASFSYFNADGEGTYRVVIEGIDADGSIGRKVFTYKVQ